MSLMLSNACVMTMRTAVVLGAQNATTQDFLGISLNKGLFHISKHGERTVRQRYVYVSDET